MNITRLREWSIVIPPNVTHLMAPEHRQPSLSGKAYGHENHELFPDGIKIITHGIVAIEGRKVKTYANHIYELEGEPRQDFIDYLTSRGIQYNPDSPLNAGKL